MRAFPSLRTCSSNWLWRASGRSLSDLFGNVCISRRNRDRRLWIWRRNRDLLLSLSLWRSVSDNQGDHHQSCPMILIFVTNLPQTPVLSKKKRMGEGGGETNWVNSFPLCSNWNVVLLNKIIQCMGVLLGKQCRFSHRTCQWDQWLQTSDVNVYLYSGKKISLASLFLVRLVWFYFHIWTWGILWLPSTFVSGR